MQAQLSPEVQRGVTWLQNQVQIDGSLTGEASSIGTALQARSEALYTLKLLDAPSTAIAPLQTALSNDSETSAEYLARRAWALGASNIAQPALIDKLQQRQNTSGSDAGGYGGNIGYTSHALDTAFVLLAQKMAAAPDTTAVANALAYLNSAKNSDGSFVTNQQASLYVTVKALLAAAAWSSQTSTGAITAPAQQWLLAQRNASQHFGSSFENALALWALTGQTSQPAILQPLAEALKADQLANGSWNDDPYLTALALRALFLVTQTPPAPTTGAISGMVIDAASTQSLAGVTVQIITGTQMNTSSSPNGSFGFADVAPGTLTIHFAKLGYVSKDIEVTLAAGDNLYMGTVALLPAPLTVSLSGIVKNQSGIPLADVTVSVGNASALTDTLGAYLIAGLNSGAATVTVSAAGYQTISSKITFAAGTGYTFSPRLSATGNFPPYSTILNGVVVDAETGQALAGATAQLGAASRTTGVGGTFLFDPVTAGTFVLTVSASGYQTVTISGIAVLGTNGLGDIALVRVPSSSTLTGTVTDALTHQPIGAASVSVQGQGSPVTTGADGKYSLAGLSGTSFTLNVAANGYLNQSKSVTLTQAGTAIVDVALHAPSLANPVISGIVVDAFNSMAMAGVAVQILTGTPLSTTTGANGGFAFTSATPGALTLRFSKAGYTSREFSATLGTGQSLNMGTVTLTPMPLTASLSGVVKDLGGNPLHDVTVAVGAVSVLTDTLGAYQIAGLSPGAATITVSAANYQTVSTSVNFVAGTGYTFSPTLYANGVTPPGSTSLSGVVVDAASKQPLAGATVQFGATSQITGAGGAFSFNPTAAGAFVLTVSANGYQTSTASGTTVAGANNVGNIGLVPLPVTSTVSGTVTDAVTHLPINAASVSVQGQGSAVVTGADGKYSIAGLTGTSFTINVTAVGYQARSQSIVLAQVGTAVVDLVLYAQSVLGSDISFIKVATTNPSYPASGPVMLEMLLANSAASNASLLVSAKVFDAQNGLAHEYLANPIIGWQGKTYGNNPVTVGANSTLELYLDWNALQLPAGAYSIKARAVDTVGRVVAEGDAGFEVNAEATLAGGIILTPPFTQAGSNQPVGMIANVFNNGNLPVPAGPLQLSVSVNNVDTSGPAQLSGSLTVLSNGLPLNKPYGAAYDSAGNLYTANSSDSNIVKTAPNGTASVFVTLANNRTGADVAVDKFDNVWVATNVNVIKISPAGTQSIITSGMVARGIAVDTSGNLYVTGIEGGNKVLVKFDPSGTKTVLASNGLTQPNGMVFDANGILFVANYGDGTISKVDSEGKISAFVQGLKQPQGMILDGDGNLFVANSGANNILKITPSGQQSIYASGLNNPAGLHFDNAGILFVTNSGANAVVKVLSNGSVQPFAKSVASYPEGMKYDDADNLYIANAGNNTLSKLDASGNTSVLSTSLSGPKDLAIAANGDIYVANYSNGSISKISGGATTTFATGLKSPYGLAFDGDGTLHVSEYGANRISKINATGTVLPVAESVLTQAAGIKTDAAGNTYVLNTGFIGKIGASNSGRVFANGFSGAVSFAFAADGSIYVREYTALKKVDAGGTVTTIKSGLPLSHGGLVLDAGGDTYMTDFSARKVVRMDASGALTTFANLPASPVDLVADNAGGFYVLLSTGEIDRVSATGTVSILTKLSGLNPRHLVLHASGMLYLTTSHHGIKAIDAGGVASDWMTSLVQPGAITINQAGNIVFVEDGSNTLNEYTQQRNQVSVIAGFRSPQAMAWDGSKFIFSDANGRISSLAPGQNPQPVGYGAGNASYVAVKNGVVYFTNNASLYTLDALGKPLTYYSPDLFKGSSGFALRSDGAASVADRTVHRVITIDAAKQVIASYAGIMGPKAIALDASNNVYVSTSVSQIVKIDADGKHSTVFDSSINTNGLRFDASGTLYSSDASNVYQYSTGARQAVAASTSGITGFTLNGSDVYAGIYQGSIRKVQAGKWGTFAIGLGDPFGVKVGADGTVYVANTNSNVISKVANGAISAHTSAVLNPGVLALDKAGTLYAGNSSGSVYAIDAAGKVSDLNLGQVVASMVTGIAVDAANRLAITVAYQNREYTVDLPPTPTPPLPGTVVHTATVNAGALNLGADPIPVDFGSWVPVYGGEYTVKITSAQPGVGGQLTNQFYVGPSASGKIAVDRPAVPPGDQTIGVQVKVEGADFTSMAKVDTSNLAKAVSIGVYPSAMGTDAAGNLYIAQQGIKQLKRFTPNGQASDFYTTTDSYISMRGHIPVDSQQNIYIVTYEGNILKIAPNGSASVFGTIPRGIASIEINSRDELIVSPFGTRSLIKFGTDGKKTDYTTVAIPYARSITIDGHDNIYGENYDGGVTKITPDGNISIVAAGAKFEEEGSSHIAGDCSDNLFLTPWEWDKMGQKMSEENLLYQVNGRTGKTAQIMDGATISRDLIDMDVIVYDRFSNHLVIWTDSSGNKVFRLPVTCGALSTDLHMVFPHGQITTGFNLTPKAVIAQPDGSTEYVWALKDVNASGQNVAFNTTLAGLQFADIKSIASDAFLMFKNSFVPGHIKIPLAIPKVTVGSIVAMGVATDKPSYPARTDALIDLSMTNPNADPVTGTLTVHITDKADVVVAPVLTQAATVPANGELTLAPQPVFNTADIVAGDYKVVGKLANAQGVVQAEASAVFSITSSNALSAKITTDKQTYLASDTVRLNSRITNLSTNAALDDSRITTTVKNPDGTVRFTKTEILPQLGQGSLKDYNYLVQLIAAPAGQYSATLTVGKADGAQLAQSSTQFSVSASSTTGSGLTGTLAAAPKQVKQGELVLLDFSAGNAGNSAFTDLPLILAVVNPDTQTIVKQWPYTTTLEQGKSFAASENWITAGIGAGNYVAVLSATVGGNTIALAQDSIQIALPAADVGLGISSGNPNPKYGETVALTLTASNAGPAAAASVVVTNALPAGLTLVSATAGAGSFDNGAGVWTIGSLASGASATLTLNAKVTGTTPMTASASVTSTSSDPNSASVTLTPAATDSRLTLALLAATQRVAADGTVLLSVTLNNAGPDAAKDIALKLTPNKLSIATVLPSSGSVDAASSVWTLDSLAGGASTTLILRATNAGDMASLAAQVTQANGITPDPVIQSQVTVNPLDCACTDVGVNITPSAATAGVGSAVDWTIVASNRGPDPALAARVTIALPATLSLISGNPGQGSYDAGSGQWDLGNLQAGETATLTLRTTVNAASASTITAAIQVASEPAQSNDLMPADNSAQASVNAAVSASALAVTQTVDPAAAAIGAPVKLTLTVQNAGPQAASGVLVADLLPAGLSFVSATPSQGSYDAATGLWRVGALAAPASATLTIEATMGSDMLHTNGAIVYADQIDPALADNVARSEVKQAQADLAIALHADQLAPKAGQTVTLSVTVNNRGPSTAAAVTVNAMLPNGLSFVSAAPGAGSYSASTGIWTVGDMANGANATLVVTAKAATAATVTNTVSVAGTTTDPDTGNNTASVTLTVSSVADLGMTVAAHTVKPNVGDPVTLTISVHNSGPSAAQAVVVSDSLPSGLSFVSAVASAGSYNHASGIWTIGDIAGGAGATLTLVKLTTATAVTHSATITSTTFDPNSANNSASVTLTPIQPLTGSIAASPKPGSVDGSMLFTGEVGNQGETDLSGVPLTVTVKNAATLATVQQWNLSANIAHGKTFGIAQNWSTTGVNPGDYLVVLSATFAGETQTLAQDSFTLIQAVKLDIQQTLSNGSRVLVLVSCKDGESEVVTSDGKPPVCLTTRTHIIDQALTALGVSYTITTNEAAFKLALRSGLYNTTWVSGKQDKLHDDLAAEIREAVFAGDGMIMDGEHDQRNKTLDSVAGLTWKGKIGETGLPVDINGPLFSTQTLATVGRAQKMERDGSIQQAAFHGSKPNSTGPAILSNTYGNGHALTFGFDLPFSLQAQAKWLPILGSGLHAVMPAQAATLTPEGVLSVKTSIANQAKATDIEVKSILPAGADYVSSNPAGSYSDATRTIAWAFHLAEAQTRDVFLLLQAPATAGDSSLQTTVATVRNGIATPYGNALSLPVKVVAAAQSSVDTTKALQALVLTQNKDQKLRDALITALQEAMTAFNKNTTVGYQTAIDKLLDIAERLGGLPVETGAVRLGIDRILKEAQWRWVLAQPAGSP